MKKNLFFVSLVALSMGFVACSDDNNNAPQGSEDDTQSALVCIEQIIDGCLDISDEVGTAKIGDPYDLFKSGQTEKALYSVESWYSWHSREDYSNNIRSIRNAYFGTRDGKVAPASLATVIKANNAQLDTQVRNAIDEAVRAIEAIPHPFRNNIGDPAVKTAMDACEMLNETLEDLKGYIQRTAKVNTDAVLQPVLETYVNDVVLPTYKDLKEKNAALYAAAKAFADAPSDRLFENVCEAWLEAREPWETSEAFLFGPVDALGLDPNMDSWPLDQEAIVNILNSGEFDNLTWGDGDDDDAIEAVQSVRGFHTMEFLAFKNGEARTINGGTSTDPKDLDYTASNAKSWGNYMVQVGKLLQQDAELLYESWTQSYEGGKAYKDLFLNHSIGSEYEDE
ncbi:MAG: peptidase M75 [Bacteroidaceae bacterium]|nr:peptidase M75 [Bacteroidaceae bacterium]